MMKSLYIFIKSIGLDFRLFFYSILGIPKFLKDYRLLIQQIKKEKYQVAIKPFKPILTDWNSEAGIARGHYFHQDLYVSRLIFQKSPKRHIDIGSRIDGFVAHVASFREIEVIDIREVKASIKNIKFECIDLMSKHDNLINITDSLSCLHALEHFGLGRYGDSIDINGFTNGFENISKLLSANGLFYFSVPIGSQRIEFNAHRIFSIKYLIDFVSRHYEILEFSYVDDLGDFHENVYLSEQEINNNFGCEYGCGIFILKKKSLNLTKTN